MTILSPGMREGEATTMTGQTEDMTSGAFFMANIYPWMQWDW